MRISRSEQLHVDSGSVHNMWRCHNRENYLESNLMKALFLRCMKLGLDSSISAGNVLLHSYCLMTNHVHQANSYKNGHRWLSRVLHYTNFLFGMRFNRLKKRSGKVGEDRPKTPLVQDVPRLMRLQFYIEANPIRAGISSFGKLKFYKFNSYRFYAFGIVDEFTDFLTPPAWYLELGPAPKERQREYRRLFLQYLQESKDRKENYLYPFIGSTDWVENALSFVRAKRENRQQLRMEQILTNTC